MGIRHSDTDLGWINRRFADLQKQLNELRSEKRLQAATISEGGLTIDKGGQIRLVAADGTTIFRIFSDPDVPEPDGDAQPRVHMHRSDGTLAMSLDDPLPGVDGYNQILRFFDRAGNEIWAEDTTSGTGLATPWLTNTLYPARYTDWLSTASGTFETIWTGYVTKTHPKLRMLVRHTTDESTTTGEVRVLAEGTVWGSAVPVGFALDTAIWDGSLPGAINNATLVEIQARRTGGPGQVRTAPQRVAARQT